MKKKVMSTLYWLCKEVTHSKLNLLLEIFQSLWVEEVETLKKRSTES